MSATALPVTQNLVVPYNGLNSGNVAVETAADNVNSNTFVNTGTEVLVVRNSAGGTENLTITRLIGDNDVLALAASDSYVVGPFDPKLYGTLVTVTAAASSVKLYTVDLSGQPNLLTR